MLVKSSMFTVFSADVVEIFDFYIFLPQKLVKFSIFTFFLRMLILVTCSIFSFFASHLVLLYHMSNI